MNTVYTVSSGRTQNCAAVRMLFNGCICVKISLMNKRVEI